jgi:hypothetical protein
VAYFVAGTNALVGVLAWFDVIHLRDLLPWAFIITAALYTVIAFFTSRKSRVAASLGLAFCLFEALNHLLSAGLSDGGSALWLVLAMFSINGVRGAFALVRLRQQSDDLAPIAEPT